MYSSIQTSTLAGYIAENANVNWEAGEIPTCPIPVFTKGMEANAYFFGHPEWGRDYFENDHRDQVFGERWQAAMGSWDDKIVVDVGCGPGNVFATVGGSPKLLIGVDISLGALKMARDIGYTPIIADAHNLPFIDGFADIVVASATLHHCDDMGRVLAQAARLVRPGGILVTDLDPQVTAWNLKGLGLLLRNIRYPIYRLLGYQYYISPDKRDARRDTEIHNKQPGDGITPELYHQVLEPMGFTIRVLPHNHDVGAEILNGSYGKATWRIRLTQFLSGINPNSIEAAQSILCIAKRQG
jgi:SAM-dependent methyltransferase